MPPDVFEITVEQKPPEISELSVAIPLSYNWPRLQETATHDPAMRFTANLPLSTVSYDEMTMVQKWAVDVGCDSSQQILYLLGTAGSGKTTVALKTDCTIVCDWTVFSSFDTILANHRVVAYRLWLHTSTVTEN